MAREITKRFVLHVGFSCNARCRFCYYRESLEQGKVRDLTYEEVKKRLDLARKHGKTQVDLSGGEPTIRKDIFDIIKYAKSIGYETVSMITNGLMMKNHDFCKRLKDAGLDDLLFSVHGVEKEMHDYLTCVKGSWDSIMKAIDHAKELKINVRINTVITNLNYNRLDDYFELMDKLKPDAINLLVFNPAEEVIHYRKDDVTVQDYHEIGNKLKKALDKHGSKHKMINIRFLPFCLLKGQEKRVRTMWQKIYEKEEWDPMLFMWFRKGFWYIPLFAVAGFFISLFNPYYRLPFHGKKSFYTRFGEFVQSARIFYNKKHVKECKACSLRKICPGLNKAYVKKVNKTRVVPYEGKVIKDPLHFCKQYEEHF